MRTDAEALEDARREAMGLPPLDRNPRNGGGGGAGGGGGGAGGQSTDDQVYERFKKRMRK